jgi:hypothetical protein
LRRGHENNFSCSARSSDPLAASFLSAQMSPELKKQQWEARWITCGDAP